MRSEKMWTVVGERTRDRELSKDEHVGEGECRGSKERTEGGNESLGWEVPTALGKHEETSLGR